MALSQTPWLDPDQDAPDPVDFARAQAQAGPSEAAARQDIGDPSMPQALAMIAEALRTLKTEDVGAAARLASIERLLVSEAQARPHENLFNPPMISQANPDGERDHPRPELACRMTWVGFELNKEGLTRQEIELLNRMEPGEYRVTKADGRRIRFTVTERRSDVGIRDLLMFQFPCKDSEDRQNHQSMVAYLQEALGVSAVQTHASLMAEVARLQAVLAAQSAPVAA